MKRIQYTIRNIPGAIDGALRRRANESGRSFNQVLVDALTIGSGEVVPVRRNFGEIIGSLKPTDAKAQESEIRRQRHLDKAMWK